MLYNDGSCLLIDGFDGLSKRLVTMQPSGRMLLSTSTSPTRKNNALVSSAGDISRPESAIVIARIGAAHCCWLLQVARGVWQVEIV